MAQHIDTFEEFVDVVVDLVGAPSDRGTLRASDRVLADLGFDEIAMARLVFGLQALNPSFEVPDQVDLRDLCLGDLHHFATTQTEDHRRD